ncbi:hypothetical protein [Jeotgalibaca porci]|uniref:hypothetical protein n=1 Tax=Jeotgalibaca porci TaxID=1868793 RepID=UPI0035A02CAC
MEESLMLLAFISNIVEERNKEIAKKINKLKYRANGLSLGNLPSNQFYYNKAIDDILVLLGEDDKEAK